MPLFLPFDFPGKSVLGTSTISYSFGCKYSPVMDFRGLNSTEKTPPSPPFSPVLDICSPCRILVRNSSLQSHFPETLFCRNMQMVRESSMIH